MFDGKKTRLEISVAIAAWLDIQSADVRSELNNLIAYRPEPEFIESLSALLLVIPCHGLVDLYYDIWYCVPCRQAFRVAVKKLHRPTELAEYLKLTETILVNKSACEDFASRFGDDDDLDEIIFWLKRRARQLN
ncbi:hypothetical protein [Dechloromonas denitrificans]|uniref:hypothetical protein n=1 Tax=Dechloromonas denitrificans TaxID=281362 RepID=UPI001CF7F875|nr:hypothetical protein [Dechloromonas denitrificans]UCV05312.1 hypothetical protein KI611_08730 [Dechloromonas denitrificans]UCV09658.1 hypothetical protein KI615_09160 [Dechloromonas denitrificans]